MSICDLYFHFLRLLENIFQNVRSKEGMKRTLPSKEHMESAVKEALQGTLSIRAAADKYEVSKSAVVRRVAANS